MDIVDAIIEAPVWSEFIKWRRKNRKNFAAETRCTTESIKPGEKVKVKLRRDACPYCGASNTDAFFHPEVKKMGWIDSKGVFHEGAPIYWNTRPNYAACLNCKREFKVEIEVAVTVRDAIFHEAEIQKKCPRCGYPWFKYGQIKSYQKIVRLEDAGIIGYRCASCGESFYFWKIPRAAPWKPHVSMVKDFKSRREFGNWQDYRTRFKISVVGPYVWKKREEESQNQEDLTMDGGVTPEKHIVRGAFKRFLTREKFTVKKARMERRQIDFERRIKPMIELVLENECFSRQKNRIIEDVLRFTHYVWL
ncbi:MAG: hypothetical protein RMJ15_00005, partial [Nitrososphaerota archaeon]|nr:hypothetical protein [Nitrososphaerota archaeon]